MDDSAVVRIYLALLSCHVVLVNVATFQGYRKWAPANSTRDDMYCPDNCYDNPDEDERCCYCGARTCWETDITSCDASFGQLNIEYKDIYGSAVLIPTGNYSLYEIVHRNGRLTKFPENLCEFADSLVRLDLSYNKLENISDIRCLNKLDTLILDGNKIKEVSNDTFSEMEHLRIVSLSRNIIETIQPNTFQKKIGNVFVIDLSYNIVETIDITNILLPGPFCNMSCEGCEIREKTNILNYTIDNDIHGPGSVILTNTSGRSFPNFTLYGVDDMSDLPKYFKGRFELDGSSVYCDCNIYPFFSQLGKDATKYWPRISYSDVICTEPENMRGRNLSNLYETQIFEELRCNLPNCPRNCTCTDRPSADNVRVVCKDLSKMPDFVPVGYWRNDRIDLDLSDQSNDISDFSNGGYNNRLENVDFGDNSLQTIGMEAVIGLSDDVTLSMQNQHLQYLPYSFHKLNPKNIVFGTNPVRCDCENTWIGEWIRLNRAEGSLQCSTSKGIVPAEAVNSEYLECLEQESLPIFVPILLTILTVSAFLISVAAYCFRYEMMLLKRKIINIRKKSGNCRFDAMLTYSQENPYIFRWLEHALIPALKEEGYSLFVPFYSIKFGADREHKLADAVNESGNYVVFLCDMYLCDENSVQEFEMVWKHFCMNTSKNIIVINYDMLRSSDIKDPRLRAFVRIHDDLNFVEREEKMFERLKRRLGLPKKLARPAQIAQIEDKVKDNVRNTRWHNHLEAKSTACDTFTHRKCYVHAREAFNVNAENDWLRKREKATRRKKIISVSPLSSVV